MKKCRFLWIAAAILAMALVLAGCGSTKLDLTQFVTVKFDGINGKGTASCQLNSVALEQALAGDTDGEISTEELQKLGWITQFEMTLYCQLNAASDLSNGDKVTVTVSCDEELAKDNKVKITGNTKEFTVEGLKDTIEIDPFSEDFFGKEDGVNTILTGVSPKARYRIENNCKQKPESMVCYDVVKLDSTDAEKGIPGTHVNDVANGDRLKIVATLAYGADQEGYVLSQTEKVITVEGLDAYVTDISQLNEQGQKALHELCDKRFQEAAADVIYFYVDVMKYEPLRPTSYDVSYPNFAYAEDVYKTDSDNVVIVPFNVDVEIGKIDWGYKWDEYKNVTDASFPGSWGFFWVENLMADPEGNLKETEDTEIGSPNVYQDKQDMDQEIIRRYGLG